MIAVELPPPPIAAPHAVRSGGGFETQSPASRVFTCQTRRVVYNPQTGRCALAGWFGHAAGFGCRAALHSALLADKDKHVNQIKVNYLKRCGWHRPIDRHGTVV